MILVSSFDLGSLCIQVHGSFSHTFFNVNKDRSSQSCFTGNVVVGTVAPTAPALHSYFHALIFIVFNFSAGLAGLGMQRLPAVNFLWL